MNELHVSIDGQRRAFEPSEDVAGQVSWKLDKPPRALELRLFWFTRGKGTPDAGVVERLRFESAGIDESRSFRFRLPDGPYSFSGKLISLVWGLELLADPLKEVARVEITVAPTAQEVVLANAGPSQNPFTLIR